MRLEMPCAMQANVTNAFLAYSASLNLSYTSEDDFQMRMQKFQDSLFEVAVANAEASPYVVSKARRGEQGGWMRLACSLHDEVFHKWPENSYQPYNCARCQCLMICIFNGSCVNAGCAPLLQSGINKLAGWTDSELSMLAGGTDFEQKQCVPPELYDQYLQYQRGANATSRNVATTAAALSTAARVPAQFDWESKGLVTPVKDQGKCRSSWAFAAAAAIETLWATQTQTLTAVSPQAFVDCQRVPGFFGCSGERAYAVLPTNCLAHHWMQVGESAGLFAQAYS